MCANPIQGYLDNHNLHPNAISSSSFGVLWKNIYGEKERWYAKPLVFTPKAGRQLVLLASSMNILRTVDAADGTLVKERVLDPPFLVSDIPLVVSIPVKASISFISYRTIAS
jgi:iron transport multicopper oxidase